MRPLRSIIEQALLDAEILNPTLLPDAAAFSVDSRTLQPGEIFVALRGQNTDGHSFLQKALIAGAAALVVEKNHKATIVADHMMSKIPVILVTDTYEALHTIAHAWRKQFTCPVIGITGSAGKTSTRYAIQNVLEAANIPHVTSFQNQNSLSGAPLTLLRIRDFHKVAVIEMGINKRGEMLQLATLVEPTIAIITLIGHAHMEGLGEFTDIAFEKKQIFSRFKDDNIGIINGDQAALAATSYAHPVIKFGTKTTNQVQARKIKVNADGSIQFILKLYGHKERLTFPIPHRGLIFNALAAAAVGHLLNIPVATILAGILKPIVVSGRFEKVLLSNNTTIINDCYNASPESVKESLIAFGALHTTVPKLAVLGEMRELGTNTAFWHRQIGRFLRKVPSVKKVILVGPFTQWIQKTTPLSVDVTHVASWNEAVSLLTPEVASGSLILVKGSRGLTLEKLIHALQESVIQPVSIKPAVQTTV